MDGLDTELDVIYTYDSGVRIVVDETGQTMLVW